LYSVDAKAVVAGEASAGVSIFAILPV